MTHKLMLAALLALLSSAPALAQDSSNAFDSRWAPYLGCWTIVQDQFGQSAPVPAGTTVCVRPSGRYGVAITTTVDGKNVLEQTVVADGSAQAISQADCSGTQVSNWSRDGERLFTRVELDCANRPKRSVSGITLQVNGQWVDAQATVIDGNSDVRVRRFRRTTDPATAAPAATNMPLSIEDVIEASAKVQSEALEAALDELNPRFALNSRVLRQLADSGVSRNVIDLMVAQAYPDKFQIERDVYASGSSASYSGSSVSSGGTSVFMGSSAYPFPMYDPFYSSYYYYSPFAYPYYWGPYYSYRWGSPYYRNYYNYNYYGAPPPYYYGGGSGFPTGGGTAQPGSPDSPGGTGVVVNGRGYTRVRPAGSGTSSGGESATPTSRTTGSSRGARSAGSSSGADSSSSSSSSSSSGSSGSSGASGGGYSSGSSGGSSGGGGGRTAQPR